MQEVYCMTHYPFLSKETARHEQSLFFSGCRMHPESRFQQVWQLCLHLTIPFGSFLGSLQVSVSLIYDLIPELAVVESDIFRNTGSSPIFFWVS